MSDQLELSQAVLSPVDDGRAYEPHVLTSLGNARTLLAGEGGPYTDANPSGEDPQGQAVP